MRPVAFQSDPETLARAELRRGRGSVSQASGRFEPTARVGFDDGWDQAEEDAPAPLRTTVTADASRSVLTRNQSPDVPFDRSINPYRGCEHGCIYCFARPSHAYLGLSPGLDFETKLFAKFDAPALLRQELARPSYKPATIALGTNTDPYQPIEREHRIMRGILEVLTETRHPVSIVTKSHLVTRDMDLLADLARDNLVRVFLSVTTLDRPLARAMEPRAATPARRLAAIQELAAAGIPVGVMAAPMIPALNDHELEAILTAAEDAGARSAGYVLLRLPIEVKTLFKEWLNEHYPDRAQRIMNRLRAMRGGRENDPEFGSRMRGQGAEADLLALRFRQAIKRLGLNQPRAPMPSTQFRRPGRDARQMSLF
ncbi:PA0069 family radical SAM protein [Govanella unica]|uniref:PA0069 family radical SAM protein n=1 Tax=Govanella unica TaxID=2975056 RepID=A0A9X3Z6Q7_9PROT|nr:PA0069 family radical SAM protein [Govania unica]MDA5193381.1 PA0069 family radical SAM protein [Govania unica]